MQSMPCRQLSRPAGAGEFKLSPSRIIMFSYPIHRLIYIALSVRLIPGEEVATNEGEIIGLFLQRVIPPGLSAEETISAIKEQGGVASCPIH